MQKINQDTRWRLASVGWVMPKVLIKAAANASRMRMGILYEITNDFEFVTSCEFATFCSPGHPMEVDR